MGRDVASTTFTREDRQRHREKVRRCLDVLARMLSDFRFEQERPLTGLEIELNLVDTDYAPAMRNDQVLELIENPAFQTELGQFNLETNLMPRRIAGAGLASYEEDVRATLDVADDRAVKADSHLVMVGILPTLRQGDCGSETFSDSPRYRLLNEQILAARGEDVEINIAGADHLRMRSDTIMPEAACTSVQLHLQTSPDTFADYWNAAQAIASLQLAVGANSPFLFGRQLWQETRIALFEQAIDTRPEELRAQGVRPRVWFGERWATSIFDLFEENVRYFPALLPILEEEDPVEVLARGATPQLAELCLHNGTIYRWNRPVYDVVDGRPHLRVENRVLPAGPTTIDVVANAAFYFGLVAHLAEADRPIWSQMPLRTAAENLHAAARHGIDAKVYWPGVGEIFATELVLRRLLPRAAAGLDSWGVDPSDRDRLLGVIERRCVAGRNGASWQVETVRRLERDRNLDRPAALREMLRAYCEHMRSGDPVHTWPIAA
ncbi:MAG: glutamate-cysteine ligase family protein [Streptosporangiales bacterium]